jgi:hypothetical protein
MEEAKEFKDANEMKRYIAEDWQKDWGEQATFSVDDITIDDRTVNDERIGWEDTRYVCVKRMGDKVYNIPQCIGMCATKYPIQEKAAPKTQKTTPTGSSNRLIVNR